MDFNNLQSEQLIKVGAVVGEAIILAIMVIYFIFAFILSRRIRVMNLNLKTPYEKSFITIARIHTFASLIAVIITLLSIRV